MPLSATQPRITDDDVVLVTRSFITDYTGRDHMTVRRNCQPIACDVATRALLFDLHDADARLAARPRVA